MNRRARWEVVLVGERADLAAGPFEADWGRVRTAGPGDTDSDGADLVVLLEPALAASPSARTTQIVWHPAEASAATAVARPWPVADDLFEMQPAAPDAGCVVLAGGGLDREQVVTELDERGLAVSFASGVTRESLADARVVVSLTPGLPAETFAILAAGRLLVAPAGGRTFGLQPWIDHLPFSTYDDVGALVDAVVTYPDAWAQVQALGRQAAMPHRAGQAIGRLVRRMQARERNA